MLTFEKVVAMPGGGEALLVAHRWIHSEGVRDCDAFSLLAILCRQFGPDEGRTMSLIALIAGNDHRSQVVLATLLLPGALESPRSAVQEAFFRDIESIPPDVAGEFARGVVRDHNNRKGAAR